MMLKACTAIFIYVLIAAFAQHDEDSFDDSPISSDMGRHASNALSGKSTLQQVEVNVNGYANDKYYKANEGWVLDPNKVPAEAFYVNGKRPPGTLLLNMLIKNEAEHLARTLPKWAKIIDAWVIGIDDNNTDNSAEVILQALGHIPGQLVPVHFTGMGPTWSVLVKTGYMAFPNITHGILADADFAPMVETMDKMELDIRCSKHLYYIYTADLTNMRKLDWVYRNMPGAVVQRRTHQALQVPPLPQQHWYITQLNTLYVDERPGGYQDRTGGAKAKAKRYIQFLEDDLEEFGQNDTRSLYYLAVGYLDLYTASIEQNGGAATQEHREILDKSISYYKRRAAIVGTDQGTREERWFALIKLGEIHERLLGRRDLAVRYYLQAARLDPERADAWFYAGQTFRLAGDYRRALPFLYTAASLHMPDRALFQWNTLYTCLSKFEYALAASLVPLSEESFVTAFTKEDSHQMSLYKSVKTSLFDADETVEDASRAIILPTSIYERLTATVPRISLPHLHAALDAARTAVEDCSKSENQRLASEASRLITVLEQSIEEANALAKPAPPAKIASPATAKQAARVTAANILPVNLPKRYPFSGHTVDAKQLRATIDVVAHAAKRVCSLAKGLPATSQLRFFGALPSQDSGSEMPASFHWCLLQEDLQMLQSHDALTCHDLRLALRLFRRIELSKGVVDEGKEDAHVAYVEALHEAVDIIKEGFRHCS